MASEAIADAVCACKDVECGKKALENGAKDFSKYKGAKTDAQQDAAMKAAGERASDCLTRLSAPPEAAAPAGPDAAP